jgi:hypothetical protein
VFCTEEVRQALNTMKKTGQAAASTALYAVFGEVDHVTGARSGGYSSPLITMFGNVLRDTNIAGAVAQQLWRRWDDTDELRISEDIRCDARLWSFVKERLRLPPNEPLNHITRAIFVTKSDAAVNAFLVLHEAECSSRAQNSALHAKVVRNDDGASAIAKLKSMFEERIPIGALPPAARIVFAWHGVAKHLVKDVCRDGPRNFRTTDPGFFGAGVYFAREAAYAAFYSKGDGERAVILFAVSLSQAYPITVKEDYRTAAEEVNIDPRCHGFSKFYSPTSGSAIALTARCDAHFIPVKQYGSVHPRTGQPTQRHVDYQAVVASAAEFHELVIGSHHRCIPIAVVYFDPSRKRPRPE